MTTPLAGWWTRKYKLPITDLAYLRRTAASLTEEFYGDLLERRDELQQLLERGGLDVSLRGELTDRLIKINGWLSDEPKSDGSQRLSGDDLVDEWEAALDRGEDPDLEAGLPPEILAKLHKPG